MISIGIAALRDKDDTAASVLKRADQALYRELSRAAGVRPLKACAPITCSAINLLTLLA
jgi:GGDEF domain-containing protein